jgi:hypothetical protein
MSKYKPAAEGTCLGSPGTPTTRKPPKPRFSRSRGEGVTGCAGAFLISRRDVPANTGKP